MLLYNGNWAALLKLQMPTPTTDAILLVGSSVVGWKSDSSVFPMGGELTHGDTQPNAPQEARIGYRHAMKQCTPKFDTVDSNVTRQCTYLRLARGEGGGYSLA
jgi:hypothetical protein